MTVAAQMEVADGADANDNAAQFDEEGKKAEDGPENQAQATGEEATTEENQNQMEGGTKNDGKQK